MFLLYIKICTLSNININVNKNHELLINNLTPVMWEGGAMGAFFMRFIEDSNFLRNESQWKNLEWFNWDRTLQYLEQGNNHAYYVNHINGHTSLLKEKYQGIEFDKAFIYVIYQLTEPLVREHGRFELIHPIPANLSSEKVLELAEMDPIFDVANLKFTHLKCHYENTNVLINSLNWKRKIFCQFSFDKTWLVDLLMYYKKFYYTIDKPEIPISDQLKNDPVSFEKFYKNEWNKRIKNLGKRLVKDLPGYHNIDMFDLIFNKNIEQIKQLYPDFELNHFQNNMLEKVKQDIIYICSVFELDPSISFVHLRDNIEMLRSPKIKEILKKIELDSSSI
jgi:hypothetical protein